VQLVVRGGKFGLFVSLNKFRTLCEIDSVTFLQLTMKNLAGILFKMAHTANNYIDALIMKSSANES
jgi:hypothetical protein